MKAIYLVVSLILTILILIIGFQNVDAQFSNTNFLFYPLKQNPTVIILGVAVIGMITGAFYHAFIGRVLSTPEEEEDFE